MAVKSREQIIKDLQAIIGDNNSDEVIALMEDITDSVGAGGDGWEDRYNVLKADYDKLDKEWRDKYIARFQGAGSDEPPVTPPQDAEPPAPEENEDDNEPAKYEDLFDKESL